MANDDLAAALFILRILRRWSQSELAEAAGVTSSAVCNYERGKVDPQTQTLQRLLHALGLPLAALDKTLAFVLTIRAQMGTGGADESEGAAGSPQERERRADIAQIASEGGRFASRMTRLMLELLAGYTP